MINFTIILLVLNGLGFALLLLCCLLFESCLLGKSGLFADSLFVGLHIFTHLLNLLIVSIEFEDVLQCGYLLSRDNQKIEQMREDVETYEEAVRKQAALAEQARLKEQAAREQESKAKSIKNKQDNSKVKQNKSKP